MPRAGTFGHQPCRWSQSHAMRNDLRQDPSWRPERGSWAAPPWTIDLWAEPCLPGTDTYDDYLVSHAGPVTRLAVLDAVVHLANPDPEGTALTGVATARRHFRSPAHRPAAAIQEASRALCDPDVRPRHRNPGLTAAIADLHPNGTVEVAVCADSDVWVRTHAGWSSPWEADMLTPAARAAWSREVPPDGSVSGVLGARIQERLLDDPSAWAYPYIGLISNPEVRGGRMSDVLEIIVATDGARLTAERCADLDGWLGEGLQLRAPGSVYPSPHGDVTVLRARREQIR